MLRTSAALYECVRPAPAYRGVWAQGDDALEVAQGVYAALAPQAGGNPAASWEEVVARLARTKVGGWGDGGQGRAGEVVVVCVCEGWGWMGMGGDGWGRGLM